MNHYAIWPKASPSKPAAVKLEALQEFPVGTIFGAAGGGARGVGLIIVPGWFGSYLNDPNRRPIDRLFSQLQNAGSTLYLLSIGDGTLPTKSALTRAQNIAMGDPKVAGSGSLPAAGTESAATIVGLKRLWSNNEIGPDLIDALRRKVGMEHIRPWMRRTYPFSTVNGQPTNGLSNDNVFNLLIKDAWHSFLADGAQPLTLTRTEWIKHAAKKFNFIAEKDDNAGAGSFAEAHQPRMKEGDAVRVNEHVFVLRRGRMEDIYNPLALDEQYGVLFRARNAGLPVSDEVLSSYGISPLTVEQERKKQYEEENKKRLALEVVIDSLFETTREVSLATCAAVDRRWIALIKLKDNRRLMGFVSKDGRGSWMISGVSVKAPGTYQVKAIEPKHFLEAFLKYPWPIGSIPESNNGIRRILDTMTTPRYVVGE